MLSWEQEIQGTRVLENQKNYSKGTLELKNQKNYCNQGKQGAIEPK